MQRTPRPVRELKQFARVESEARRDENREHDAGHDAFSYFSMATHSWVVDPGEFEISVGARRAICR